MSKAHKVILGMLGFVIIASLVGIGVLTAWLVSRKDEQAKIVLPATTPLPSPAPTSTLIPVPSPAPQAQPTLPPGQPGGQPIVIAADEGGGPFAVAILTGVPLHSNRRYKLQVTSRAGSVPFHGSWSELAIGTDGKPGVKVDLLKGVTPFSMDIIPPVQNPTHWSFSVSVQSEKNEGGIMVAILDVTGR